MIDVDFDEFNEYLDEGCIQDVEDWSKKKRCNNMEQFKLKYNIEVYILELEMLLVEVKIIVKKDKYMLFCIVFYLDD